jgi:hypothetical protein
MWGGRPAERRLKAAGSRFHSGPLQAFALIRLLRLIKPPNPSNPSNALHLIIFHSALYLSKTAFCLRGISSPQSGRSAEGAKHTSPGQAH